LEPEPEPKLEPEPDPKLEPEPLPKPEPPLRPDENPLPDRDPPYCASKTLQNKNAMAIPSPNPIRISLLQVEIEVTPNLGRWDYDKASRQTGQAKFDPAGIRKRKKRYFLFPMQMLQQSQESIHV